METVKNILILVLNRLKISLLNKKAMSAHIGQGISFDAVLKMFLSIYF